ncbi:MAG: hypothetical protein J5806_14830 [Lentisphaeria bacterium]|nr:hypothetical protein [Lentisphaeria bacterium]
MYQGLVRQNKKIFRYDGGRGEIWDMNGKKLAFWKASEDALYPGPGGVPMYIYADKGAHPRSKGAMALFFIDGRKIYHGNGPAGNLILYPDSPLPTPVAIYLAHVVTGGKPAPKPGMKVDWAQVPYGYYLGPKGQGKILLSLRGNRIFFNDQAKGTPAYTVVGGFKFYRGENTTGEPAFCMTNNGALFKGGTPSRENEVMHIEWFNCYAPGKTGPDAFGTAHPAGDTLLTEGYVQKSPRPNLAGRRILLSSTLPNNRVMFSVRLFLIYLTQLDPDFKAYAASQQ